MSSYTKRIGEAGSGDVAQPASPPDVESAGGTRARGAEGWCARVRRTGRPGLVVLCGVASAGLAVLGGLSYARPQCSELDQGIPDGEGESGRQLSPGRGGQCHKKEWFEPVLQKQKEADNLLQNRIDFATRGVLSEEVLNGLGLDKETSSRLLKAVEAGEVGREVSELFSSGGGQAVKLLRDLDQFVKALGLDQIAKRVIRALDVKKEKDLFSLVLDVKKAKVLFSLVRDEVSKMDVTKAFKKAFPSTGTAQNRKRKISGDDRMAKRTMYSRSNVNQAMTPTLVASSRRLSGGVSVDIHPEQVARLVAPGNALEDACQISRYGREGQAGDRFKRLVRKPKNYFANCVATVANALDGDRGRKVMKFAAGVFTVAVATNVIISMLPVKEQPASGSLLVTTTTARATLAKFYTTRKAEPGPEPTGKADPISEASGLDDVRPAQTDDEDFFRAAVHQNADEALSQIRADGKGLSGTTVVVGAAAGPQPQQFAECVAGAVKDDLLKRLRMVRGVNAAALGSVAMYGLGNMLAGVLR